MKLQNSLISRQWILPLAQLYGQRLGMADNLALHDAATTASQEATRLLNLAPWHMRLLIGMAETVASIWCSLYRLINHKNINLMQEVQTFEKWSLISRPLLRVYRSLAAIAWFEHPTVLFHYGLNEKPEVRQERFRQIRTTRV